MTIAHVAGAARRARRLSQSFVASRAGEAESNLSVIESGRRSPSAVKLDRILRASNARLAVVPTTREGALEASSEVRRALQEKNERLAFRVWLSYNDALLAETAVNRVVLAAFPPEPTGSPVYDAAFAAVTEYRLREVSAPVPAWVEETEALGEPVILADSPYVLSVDPATVPEPFLRRGVLIHEGTLESV